MPYKFFPQYLNQGKPLPSKELWSSVFLIAFQGSKMLIIENDRGWDLPGGHIEPGETPEEALIREVKEEGGAVFAEAKLFAFIESDDQGRYKDKIMLMYTSESFPNSVKKSIDLLRKDLSTAIPRVGLQLWKNYSTYTPCMLHNFSFALLCPPAGGARNLKISPRKSLRSRSNVSCWSYTSYARCAFLEDSRRFRYS